MQTILSYIWGRIQVYSKRIFHDQTKLIWTLLILKLYLITCKMSNILLSFYRLIIYFTFTENRFIVTMCLTVRN